MEQQARDYSCISGRHFYRSRVEANISNCCKPYTIDVPALLQKKSYEKGRLPALEKKVEQITSELQKFKDLKLDLQRQVAAKKAARSEAISRGEQPPSDAELISIPGDVLVVDGLVSRESASLAEAKAAVSQCRFSINSIMASLSLAAKYKRRDEIHSKMKRLLLEWNDCVVHILELRREHGLDLTDGALNLPAHYPLFPPGFVEWQRGEPAPIYYLRPENNISPKDILERKSRGRK
jgi:hypothetical protein